MKKVLVYTSTRADFGLLKPLIARLKKTDGLQVELFVTGTHLSLEHGYTVTEIEPDFSENIAYRVPYAVKENRDLRGLGIMSEILQKYAEALTDRRPDIAIVLGDRYEAFCFGVACSLLTIPLAHLHGGELTLGALDDQFRHCLTKSSRWHFVACERYRQRVIQLGENPAYVFNVGALGVENALKQKLILRAELEKQLNFTFGQELYLMTFHPETLSADYGEEILNAFLDRLADRIKNHGAKAIITGVNSDPGSERIRAALNRFGAAYPEACLYVEPLGMVRYLSVMKEATAVVGNSSSGILEAYSLQTPALNLGRRQEGREREPTVIDMPSVPQIHVFDFSAVVALKESLRENQKESIFGKGKTSDLIAQRIQAIVSEADFPQIAAKRFFDLPESEG